MSIVSPTFNVASEDIVVKRPPAVNVVSSKLCAPVVVADVVREDPENSVVVDEASSLSAPVDTSTDSDELTRSAAAATSATPPARSVISVPTVRPSSSASTEPAPAKPTVKSPSPSSLAPCVVTTRSSPTDKTASSFTVIKSAPADALSACITSSSTLSLRLVIWPPVDTSNDLVADTDRESPTATVASPPVRRLPSVAASSCTDSALTSSSSPPRTVVVPAASTVTSSLDKVVPRTTSTLTISPTTETSVPTSAFSSPAVLTRALSVPT